MFVLYDTVQYPRGRHFGNRNKIKTANGVRWLTVPVEKRGDLPAWNSVRAHNNGWARTHWRTLEVAYARAPFFDDLSGTLRELYRRDECSSLSLIDEQFLTSVLRSLKSNTRLIRASELAVTRSSLSGSEALIGIITELGGTQYISGKGPGSLRYVEPRDFAAAGIELLEYRFDSPTYQQLWGEFVPDLSIVDMLANCGDGSRHIIENAGSLHPWSAAELNPTDVRSA